MVETERLVSPILVIEDDSRARASVGRLLRGLAPVKLAADGREALDLLATGLKPSLILLDMILPAVDGWSFLALRRTDPELESIPVLIMTGLTVASDEWAKSLGADGLLRKPIDETTLLKAVEQYVS